jgi:AraC family transcriptional regulator
MDSDRLTNDSASGKESGAASLATLLCAALAAMDTDRPSARAYLERAGALLNDAEFQHGSAPREFAKGPTLMAWQAKRVEEHVTAHLCVPIAVSDLADLTRLSVSYFSRLFLRTYGTTPMGYVAARRVDRAKQLLRTSSESLSVIALECGLCDQSHLTRVFRRVVGRTPGGWRREFGRQGVLA